MRITDFNRRAILVVRADVVDKANAISAEIGGGRPFTVPLSRTGNLPAQAYACNWQFIPDQIDLVELRRAALPAIERDKMRVFRLSSWDPAVATPTFDEVLTELDLKRIEAGIP